MPQFEPGSTFARERTFTADDVRAFTRISGDDGTHHVEPDAQGRLMLQGLLTATLATEIGGSIDFLAQEMLFRFHRPVFSGDTVRCEVRVESTREEPGRLFMDLTFTMRNQQGKDVLSGNIRGMVRR